MAIATPEAEVQKSFNLANKKDHAAFADADLEDVLNEDGLTPFLKNGTESNVKVGKDQVFAIEDNGYGYERSIAYMHGGVIVRKGLNRNRDGWWKDFAEHNPIGVIAAKAPSVKGYNNFLVLNGDEDDNNLVSEYSDRFPTLSFECLSRFYPEIKDTKTKYSEFRLAELFADGTLEVVDFCSDEHRNLSPAEQAAVKKFTANRNGEYAKRDDEKYKMPKPPETGFTYVHGSWHRAATVVIKDTKAKNGKGMSILIGQDEGTYFGVELPTHPTSVKQALLDLIPKEARGADVKRQGEWFAVPVTEKAIPKVEDAIVLAESDLALPIDSPDSNRHFVNSDDIRVSKDGKVYAKNCHVVHSNGDHEELRVNGWVFFAKNTAIRSFSVEGVD